MDESSLIWAAAAAVVAVIVGPYLWLFRRRNRRDEQRKAEAARLGIDRPVAQFPFVDAGRCIGCGACVAACPEGDVLGVVRGTAMVLNGLRCIGHGLCEAACPVGAIEVGLGDLKQRQDLPLLDPFNQTSVPGLFVAGELGGLALIRNAVEQGQRVAAHISERTRGLGPAPAGVDDLVVVGAGPAGLSAAACAHGRGLRVRVLEQEGDLGGTVLHYPRRKLVLTQPAELPLGLRLEGGEHEKGALLTLLQTLQERAAVPVQFGERVSAVTAEEGRLVVHSPGGAWPARHVVLALGRRGTPRKLGVPGEELAKVAYALVDAESYRGLDLLVVGGGDSAVEAAIGLARQRDNRVTLSYRREKLVRIKQKNEERLARLVRSGAVRLLMPSEVEQITPRSVRLRTPEGLQELANDHVLVLVGGEPPLGLLRAAGVRFGGAGAASRP